MRTPLPLEASHILRLLFSLPTLSLRSEPVQILSPFLPIVATSPRSATSTKARRREMDADSPLSEITNVPRRSPRIKKFVPFMTSFSTPVRDHDLEDRYQPNEVTCADSELLSPALDAADNAVSNPSPPQPTSGAELIEIDNRVDLKTKIYTFLCRTNKTALRKTCKVWGRRLAGNKTKLQYRAFLWVVQLQKTGKDVAEALDQNEGCGCFSDFLKTTEITDVDWKTPAPEEDMRKHLELFGDKVSKPTDPNSSQNDGRSPITETVAAQEPNFSHSEFARLILVIRDDDKAKSAFLSVSQSLTKQAQDAGMKRDTYWKLIADRFNSGDVAFNVDFEGEIDGIDVSKLPLCKRTGTVLKEQFQKVRPEFTRALNNWRKSGQNDPERFRDFLSYHNGALYSICKRALIIFVCSGLGTAQTHDLLYESATKGIITGGHEEDIGEGDGVDAPSEVRSEEPRRKRGHSAVLGEVDRVSKEVKDIGSMVQNFLEGGASVTTKRQATKHDHWEEEEELFKRVKETFKELKWAEKDSLPLIVQFAKTRHDKAVEEYQQMMASRATANPQTN